MKGKYKIALMILIGVFSTLTGFADVHAETLTRETVPNVYYARSGGGKPYGTSFVENYSMDDKTVYCIEPGVAITTNLYEGTIGWINSPFSNEINQKLQLIGHYGYDYPGHKTQRFRLATQSLIWEVASGQKIELWTEIGGHGDYINVDYERNEIMKLVNAHYNTPSFNNEERTAIINQKITFTDNNNILSQFEIYKSDNSIIEIKDNTLSVTPTSVGEVNVYLRRKSYTTQPTVTFVGIDNKSQKMAFFGINDPILTTIKLNVYGPTVNVEKVDSKTQLPVARGDGELKNAVYGIYDKNNVKVGQVTIGEDSTGKSEYLPGLDKYYLLEEKTSLGYTLDTNKYFFEITSNNLHPTITVYQKIIEKEFEIFKVKADGSTTILKAEPNVTFKFYLKSNMKLYETATTDSNGHLKVKLPYGKYIVHQETSSSNFEKVEDFEITINENTEDVVTKIISNAEITAKLKVVKVDSNSNKVIVRNGIKFKIKNTDTSEYVCQNITYPNQEKICIFETTDGMFTTPYVLNSGNYQIEELENQTIDGYTWNPTPLKFSINENTKFTYDKEFGVMLEIKFSNKQVKGEFELTKYGEKMVVDNGTFKYEEILLNGVAYNLYANGNIYSQDGTLIHKDKELITTFKTNNGKFKVTNLYLGNYCLQETSTVNNHVLETKPYCFSIKYQDQYTEIVSIKITQKNYLIKSDFELTKVDFATGEVIPGALIEIYDENDKLVFKDYSDEFGIIHVKGLKYGKYKYFESEAPEGYQLNTEVHYFEILENGKIVKDTLSNKIITGDFELTKVDFATDEVIPGALIEIYDENNKLVFKDYSDEHGIIHIKGLKYGKYKYFESEAPEGYQLNTEVHYFEILENGKIVKDTLTNEIITGDFELTKVDFATGEVIPGALIEIYDENDELVFKDYSDEFGIIHVKGLKYGKYKYFESEAPEGYQLNTEVHYFEILENGKIVKDTLTNEKIIIEVPKTSVADSKIVTILTIVSIIAGLGFIIYDKRKKK